MPYFSSHKRYLIVCSAESYTQNFHAVSKETAFYYFKVCVIPHLLRYLYYAKLENILTNYTHTTFYIGVTNNLERRMYEHTNKLVEGFTEKYNVTELMYYEICEEIELALNREKILKRWKKDWKWNIIDKVNSKRENLYQNGSVLPIKTIFD